jgi:hypothetical protein
MQILLGESRPITVLGLNMQILFGGARPITALGLKVSSTNHSAQFEWADGES